MKHRLTLQECPSTTKLESAEVLRETIVELSGSNLQKTDSKSSRIGSDPLRSPNVARDEYQPRSPVILGSHNNPKEQRVSHRRQDNAVLRWISAHVLSMWNPSWKMYLMFTAGVAGAIFHHSFYKSLAGKEVVDQLQMLRYGGALAYMTKANLVASIIVAFRQQIWATVQRKALSVSAIDGLFAATEDFTAIFKGELFFKAKIAMFLVSLVWSAPLVTILTPATLTVEPSTFVSHTTCSAVRTLNFELEKTNDWREPKKLGQLSELSLSYWNMTMLNKSHPKYFDYYTTVSPKLAVVASLSAYFAKVLARPGVTVETCGTGWNCNYSISFIAPGYKCTEHANGVGSNKQALADINAPFDTSILAPQGNYTYYALAFLGDYAMQQVEIGESGFPHPPFPRHLGAFRTEPLLWVGHSVLAENHPYTSDVTDPNWNSSFIPKIFSCVHYETEYTALFTHVSGRQEANITSRRFIAPIVNTTFVPGVKATDDTNDDTTAFPEENYIYPQDIERYRLTAAYHSLGSQVRGFTNGTIFTGDGQTTLHTEAIKTKLINYHHYLPRWDLMDQIQSLYEDIILSLFSDPQLLVVAWASHPRNPSGTGSPNGADGSYPCTKWRTINRFAYDASELWLTYGIAILLAATAIAIGAVSISQNDGRVRNASFSSVVAATRGRGIDGLTWQTSAGGDVPREVMRAKLSYGLLGQEGKGRGRDMTMGFDLKHER